ncbi:MAG: prolipoprotein diacylglyceryl transferase [Clostridia bacterium]|nr:prolipoprotein diacylglyceryl transferase [Clostridia bacterium]
MRFLSDYCEVLFPKLGLSLDVYENFLEIPFGGDTLTIKFYGVIIAFGFILAALFGGRKAYVWKMSLDHMVDVLIYGIIGAVIGARLYYVAFQWDYYKNNLLSIFKIWEGGLAIYGGIIGGIIAAYFVCKKTGLPFLKLLDLIGMALPIGQGIGRWGNFTNQEAFGINTTSIFGMTSDKIVDYINSHQQEFAEYGIQMNPDLPVHPTFLYESVWCLLGFVVLYIVCQKFHKFDGQLILGYGIIYGLERTVVEGLRIDSLYIANTNLRVSQLVSLALVIVCTVITIYKFVKLNKEKKMQEVQGNV